jgi:hypothetical protein
MNLQDNKFETTNTEYLNSAGKLLYDLQNYENTYRKFRTEEYIKKGERPSLAMIKSHEDYEGFVNEVLLKWVKIYLVDSTDYHRIMYRILLYKRKKHGLNLKNKYISEGMRHSTAELLSSDIAYDIFREEINKHIVHIPSSGGTFLSALGDRKKMKKHSLKSYDNSHDDAPDGEAQFFKAHYGGNGDSLGY